MFLPKPEVPLDPLRQSQHLFLLEGQSHHLNTNWHSLRIFQVVSDEFSDWVIPLTLIVEFVSPRDCDGQ